MIANWSITELPGLQDPEQSLLLSLGILTTAQLLAFTPDTTSRQKLATNLRTKIQYVNKLVALADLSRLPSVGCQYNGLLIHTGVISSTQLAQIPAHKLHQQILRLHVATLQRRDLCPGIAQVTTWISEAKALSNI
jgi:Domain of unknown function (DUF4332)